MQAINAALIDTLAACGDVNRNVAVAANPQQSRAHATVYAAGRRAVRAPAAQHPRLLRNLAGRGARRRQRRRRAEPIYGATYLPRKFKIGFAIPPLNDVDVFAQDLGFIAIVEDGELVGYNVSVGGGMGATHGDAGNLSAPGRRDRLRRRPTRCIAVGEAVVTAQRDFGNRAVRKRARLKYTIDDRGLDWFKAEVEAPRRASPLQPARAVRVRPQRRPLRLGRRPRRPLAPDPAHSCRAHRRTATRRRISRGLREIAKVHAGGDAFPADPEPEPGHRRRARRRSAHGSTRWCASYGAGRPRATPAPLRAEAHRLRGLADLRAGDGRGRALPARAAGTRSKRCWTAHGLSAMRRSILRITGCPNGCSRPYLAEIALVGKAPGRYNLMLGADHRGQRLNALYRENIDEAADPRRARPAVRALRGEQRRRAEGFGDFLRAQPASSVPTCNAA